MLRRELSLLQRTACALLAVACVSLASGQVQDPTRSVEPNNYPAALPRRKGPPPAHMNFSLTATIALPGKLSGAPPSLAGEEARVELTGSVAATALVAGATPRVAPAPESAPEDPPAWVISADGKHRFRTIPTGGVEGEKRCRHCKAGWKRDWQLAVPAPTPSPPILSGRRLFFGARDDRVYCLRADNGHRVWAVDVGDRVSRPLSLWHDPMRDQRERKPGEPGIPSSLVLVVTDGGGSLFGLDPYDGARLASYDLAAAEGRLATPPVAGPDGTILIGRERYVASESDLFVFTLVEAPKPEPKPEGTNARDRLGGPFDEEKHRGEDRPGEPQGPGPRRAAGAASDDAPVAQGR